MPHPKQGYKTQDGKRAPGVTTIIGRFKDSGGLLWWAFEQGKAAERGEINSLYDKRDEAGDAGTLAALYGVNIQYGHHDTDVLSPITTSAVGIRINPYNGSGTITNAYDLYLNSDTLSGGTITNHWGIYQEQASTR